MMNEDIFLVAYDQIKNCNNSKLLFCFNKAAINYSFYRAKWSLWNLNEQIENDKPRTRAHNVFIDQCNIISRYMKTINLDNNWRMNIGDNRKVIGDFACFVTYRLALEN